MNLRETAKIVLNKTCPCRVARDFGEKWVGCTCGYDKDLKRIENALIAAWNAATTQAMGLVEIGGRDDSARTPDEWTCSYLAGLIAALKIAEPTKEKEHG